MCGRYELHTQPAAIALLFGLQHPPEISARYNIAPTQRVPIVRLTPGGDRELAQVRWGLVPFWAKDPSIGSKMINARAETVATAPAFRSAFKKTRCLIPASGFYEWQKRPDGSKQPMHIGMKDGGPFALAGLWTRWGPKDGEQLETCTIITGEPNEVAAPIHNRMPVIVAAGDYERWLDIELPDATELLKPYPPDDMTAYPVSTRVNSPKNDDAQIVEPISP
jgi:putative SOS response-associated peptidase YedK